MKVYQLKRTEGSASTTWSVDYAKELNDQQLAAVTAQDGPALVIAGAGSGKTRTLVYRLAYLIDRGVDPESILLLTFTRRAAQEMLQRAGLLIGGRSERVVGGTFHSVANTLLRRHGRAIGVSPGFTILDRGDSEDLIGLLRGEHGLAQKEKRFPKKGTIADIFSKCANTLQPIEEVLLGEFPHFWEHLDDLRKLQQAYALAKGKRQTLDYDDLLVKLETLLSSEEATRLAVSQRYRYILVDEYQDTNKIQAELVRHLASTHNNVMAVGDDSQSIYGFRGATFRNIMDFPTLFPGTILYKLEENYRSTQPILTLANEIISAASEKYSKRLFTRRAEGPLPVLVEAGGEHTQSRFVAQKILELREEGIPLGDIAVLFRSSFHAFDLEIELSRRDLPFEKRGGFKFIETAHVKDVLAHLRVIENPLDTVSWNRLLLLADGVGPKKARDVIGSLGSAARPAEVLRAVRGRASRALRDLAAVLDEASVSTTTSPAEHIGRVCDYYAPILKDRYDDYPKRLRDLEHLSTIAGRYMHLADLLSDLALEPPGQSVVGLEAAEQDDERLVLSTIHSAKGLEWHSVFLIWLVDGRFPSVYSFLTHDELEEERRLFYVAVTRAKRHLYLSYPINIFDRSTGSVLSKPSRFLDGVSANCMDTWALAEEDQSRPVSDWADDDL
ncbi:MAG: ATP-dependent helicase [Nitrospirales bacterium]